MLGQKEGFQDIRQIQRKAKTDHADHFESLSAHTEAVTGAGGSKSASSKNGDTKEQIAAYREILTDSEQADYLVAFKLDPRKNLKRVIKDGKKEGYVFERDELAEELNEMNKGGAFSDIELDAAALEAMFSQAGEPEQYHQSGC